LTAQQRRCFWRAPDVRAPGRDKRASALPDDFGFDRGTSASNTPQRQLEREEDLQRVEAALSRLEPDKRAMLMLCVNESMSYHEIA